MNQPIRVLQVFAQMNRGGAETMIMSLYRNINRDKVQFDFVVHTEDKCAFDDEIESLGGKIYRVPRYIGKNHLRYISSWNEFFRKHHEYKVIHGHVRSTASIYLSIAKKYGLTTIAHSHNTSSGVGLSAKVKNILQYPIRYFAEYLFACSKPAGEWLFGKNACQSDNFFILNNSIDVRKFIYNENIRRKIRKEFNIDGKLVVGHIGRFQRQKNHNLLIDIFKKIHDKNNNAVLLLVGDGELRQSIMDKVEDLELSNNVIYTGVRSDIPKLLQAMDVFVFPSLYEGLGIVVIEAQASGLPCVVSDTIPKDAYLTDLVQSIPLNASVEIWADAVLQYYDNHERIDRYYEIKSNGYDIKDSSIWLEKFYISLVG